MPYLSAASVSGFSEAVLSDCPSVISALLHLKGKAVGALADCGVSLMCADFDFVKRAIVAAAAVMFAVVDSTADVLVCVFSSHFYSSFQNYND